MDDFKRVRPEACFDKVKTKGRPKLVLNDTGKAVITNMAAIMCTDEEIAACLGVSIDTLTREENAAAFAECKEKGAGNGKKSLRRIQFEIAKKGNAAMAIWLGKQWLGQKEPERQETTDNVEDLTALGDMLQIDGENESKEDN